MDLNQDTLYIFTDGSCYPNPGPGGWAAILIWNGNVKLIYGGSEGGTNNTMELRAILEGLRAREDHTVSTILFTDSQYCVNALTKWWKGWEKKGWITGGGTPVKNQDYIREILHLADNVQFKWLKGHKGHVYNEAADKLARKGRAAVEANPTEDPDLEDIKASMAPYLPLALFGSLPFSDPETIEAVVETVDRPSLTKPLQGNLRDILAGLHFMQQSVSWTSSVSDAYKRADEFIRKAKELGEL